MTTQNVTRYVRYTANGQTSYGVLEGDTIHQLAGDFYGSQRTGQTVPLSAAKLELPVDPDTIQKVIGLNQQWTAPRGRQKHPRLWAAFQKALTATSTNVELPPETKNAEYGASMVVVIGRQVPRYTSEQDAANYVLGVAVGNDVNDPYWFGESDHPNEPTRLIAKTVETWKPLGEQIVAGLDYNNLRLKGRLNGQQTFDVSTSEMNNSVAWTIAYLSEYLTLNPGDLIYMGSPMSGDAVKIKPGDLVEAELDGVGVVRNNVVAMQAIPLYRPTAPDLERTKITPGTVTRYVRYTDATGTFYGIREGDTIRQLQGDIFQGATPTGKTVNVADVKLGVPLDATKVHKVYGIAGAYNNPATEPRIVPNPHVFIKAITALSANGDEIDLPPHATNFNFEGELVLIIGKEGRHIPKDQALDYIFGVTVGNDWSENTWYPERNKTEEPSRYLCKATDTWASLYTDIVAGLDYSDLEFQLGMNGEQISLGRTVNMSTKVPQLIHYLSHYFTLQPGDVIYTGTMNPPNFPGVRRQMQDGDVIDVEIEQIGRLTNKVVMMKRKGVSYELPDPAAVAAMQ